MIDRRVSLSRVLSLLGLGFATLTALDGCGAGGVGAAVRPKEATAAEGIGEGPCREADNSGEPLVVDWKPEQRGDLELLMKENVAIVSYSCKGFKLLKDCKVDGNYGFLGMSRKEQVVKLNNADEVKANLPLGGIGIAGSISAEMARGSTLDVAMIMIGKVKTTWAKVQADELKGDCDGATHFVKGAMIGAFVMQTGTKGQVKSAAQMFGATASGASTSEKNVQNKDGDIADCAKASPDDKKAPGQCQAFIRLELKGIIPKTPPAAAGAATPPPEVKPAGNDVAAVEASCPKGLVLAEGKCTEPKSVAAFLCNPSNATECEEQCGKGNAPSCGAAGTLYASGRGVSHDEKKARDLLTKGCTAADTKSCTNLGVLMAQGRGGAKDAAAAAKNFEKSCGDADALACGMLGMQYKNGDGVTKDDTKAVSYLQKGCDGGNDAACGTYGKMLLDGTGTAKDPAKAKDFLRRACDGTQSQACIDVGNIYEANRDVIGAKIMYQRGCWRGNMQACFDNGRMELGFGGQKDAAKRAFEMGCMRNDKMSCAAMKVLYGGHQPVFPGPETMDASRRCDMGGSPRDCGVAGLINLATGNPMGQSQIERACMQQDGLACAVKAATKK